MPSGMFSRLSLNVTIEQHHGLITGKIPLEQHGVKLLAQGHNGMVKQPCG